MTWTYDDRFIAEEAWAEMWAEICSDEEDLRLWNEAENRDKEIQEEVSRLVEQGLVDIPF